MSLGCTAKPLEPIYHLTSVYYMIRLKSRMLLLQSRIEKSNNIQYKNNDNSSSIAELFTVFDDVRNAQLIEVHPDKYIDTEREDITLKNVYVLLCAYKNGNKIIPVQFEIKERLNNAKNNLYVSITLGKIKIEDKVSVAVSDEINNHQTKDTRLSSNISVPKLISGVNSKYCDFFKKDNIVDFARGNINIKIGTNDYNAEVVVAITKGQEMQLYDIVNIKTTSVTTKYSKKKEGAPYSSTISKIENYRPGATSFNGILSQDKPIVNSNDMQNKVDYSTK